MPCGSRIGIDGMAKLCNIHILHQIEVMIIGNTLCSLINFKMPTCDVRVRCVPPHSSVL